MPKPSRDEEDMDVDDRSSDGSDDGADLEGFIVGDEDDAQDTESGSSAPEDGGNEVEEVLAESKKITEGISSTVVGGRTLRNREMIKKPEPFFDAEAYAKIMEAEEKREKIQMLKSWAADGEYVCPILKSLTKKTDVEIVEEEYRKAKRALEIPDTDDEDDDEEDMDEDDDDEEVEEEDDDEEETEDEDEEDEDEEEEEEDE
jgi:hypothetical protein